MQFESKDRFLVKT